MIGRRSHDDAQSFEAALNGAPPRAEHIADLVRFAEDICEAAAVEPSPAFRDSLRTQLMTEAATVLVPRQATPRQAAPRRPEPRKSAMRRRTATLTAAAIASAGAVGLVATSASAVPGEILYPVKRTVESVELQLHRSDASRGSFQLERASERLGEARQLSADGRSVTLIADTLDDFAAAAADGSDDLFTDFDATGEEKSIRKVNDFAAAASIDLSELSAQLPEGVADSFDAAKAAVTDLVAEASSLCSACAPADVGPLVNAVTDLAKKTPTEPAKDAGKVDGDQPGGDSLGGGQTGGDEVGGDKASRPKGASDTPAPAASAAAPSATPRPAATSTPAPPAPVVPTKTPSLTDVTDPLLGGLLGDDEQVGLVPGLLGGLLGQPPK
jgi:hypothetical protein